MSKKDRIAIVLSIVMFFPIAFFPRSQVLRL